MDRTFGEQAPRVKTRDRMTIKVRFPRTVRYPRVVWGLIFGHAVEIILGHPHVSKPSEHQHIDILFARETFFTFNVQVTMDFFNESHPLFEEPYPYHALMAMFGEVGGRAGFHVEPVADAK